MRVVVVRSIATSAGTAAAVRLVFIKLREMNSRIEGQGRSIRK